MKDYRDNFYYKVLIDGVEPEGLNANIESIEINEEMKAMASGSISVRDPNHIYSDILVQGMPIEIEWGYKGRYENFLSFDAPNEIKRVLKHRRLKCQINNPSGGGDSSGNTTYNCNFMGWEYQKNEVEVGAVYKNMTRGDAIRVIMTKLGILNAVVLFDRMGEVLKDDTHIRQMEPNFALLNRLAQEWHCVFVTGSILGVQSGLFADEAKIGTPAVTSFINSVTNSTGSVRTLEYGAGSLANTVSYSWQRHIGEGGQGDHVTLQVIDGQEVFTRRVIEDKKVKVLRLNEKLIEKEAQTPEGQKELLSLIMKAKSLNDQVDGKSVRRYFTVITETTAPQGLGYSVEAELVGDPLLFPSLEVKFGNGFPSALHTTEGEPVKFFIKSVQHSLGNSGYTCSVSIGDIISVYGSFVR